MKRSITTLAILFQSVLLGENLRQYIILSPKSNLDAVIVSGGLAESSYRPEQRTGISPSSGTDTRPTN
jgi:hypothetical protein